MDSLKLILLIVVTMFFALNMGGSGIAPTFSAAYGGKLIKKKTAIVLFTIFVLCGALLLGKNVAKTLSQGILPREFMSLEVALIIISSATLSLFIANILGIPESTSMVTVGAVTGAGLYFKHLNIKTFLWLIPMWLAFPAISFLATFFIYKLVYPPRSSNLWIYERFFTNERKLKKFALLISCYGAFAVGTNNVANAVGPLSASGVIKPLTGMALIAPAFGLGALLFGKRNIETFGKEVVPLGIITSNIVCLVTGSLLIIASSLGAPFPYVQLTALSIFAISCIKDGHRFTLGHHITRKMFLVWTLTPLLSAGVSFLLLSLFVR